MKKITETLRPAIICFVIMTVLCGIIYTAVITGVAKLVFPKQANGSIITVTLKDGAKKDYGSALIAQEFTKSKYLIGRPMGMSNLSPTSQKQKELVEKRIEWWKQFDPKNKEKIPLDLLTASGSGVDPNITPEAAEFQVKRIAEVRGISEDQVRSVIKKYTSKRLFGFIGEPGVNVLKVNLTLDNLM